MTAEEFFSLAKKNHAEMIDLKFADMLGSWQHCSFPIELWDADTFTDGLGFDGSSIRGWMGIHESDTLAVPDAATGCLDPFLFLLRGDVFTEDLARTWITYKREKELDPIRLRPHPHDFYLYYDN